MSISDYLSGIMHAGSQILQIPTIGCLIVLTMLVSFCVGWLTVEYFAERRHFKINHVQTIARMRAGDYGSIRDIVNESALLADQKKRLLVVVDNMGLRDEELYALAQIEIAKGERIYKRRVNLTDMIAKIGPMLGLMGTLIPLGPGIVAMGQGKVELLSQSLLIAFDTTILGLVSAVVAMVVSRFRKTWYGQYSTVMRSLFMCILDEAEAAREESVELPYQAKGHTRKDLEQAQPPSAAPAYPLPGFHRQPELVQAYPPSAAHVQQPTAQLQPELTAQAVAQESHQQMASGVARVGAAESQRQGAGAAAFATGLDDPSLQSARIDDAGLFATGDTLAQQLLERPSTSSFRMEGAVR